MSEPETPVRTERVEDALYVTIDRPQRRNALSMATLDALGQAFSGAANDVALKFAVLRGAGDKAFAAGGDLDELDALRTIEEARAMSERGKRALNAIRGFPAPVLAAINGAALGGGAELALACDMRVAAAHAQMGYVQAKLAIAPAWGGAVELFDKLPTSTAMRLLTRFEVLDSEKARALGLIDEVAQPGEALDDLVKRFTAPWRTQAAHVLRAMKAQAVARRTMSHSERLELETRLLSELWVHPAHWAAAEALRSPK